jgi:hypothetical protein
MDKEKYEKLLEEYIGSTDGAVDELEIIGDYIEFGKIRQAMYNWSEPVFLGVTKLMQDLELQEKGILGKIGRSRAWKRFQKSKTGNFLKMPEGVLADDKKSMKERWDTYIMGVLYIHSLVAFSVFGLSLPTNAYLGILALGLGGNTVFSVTGNMIASTLRIGLHYQDFKKFAKKNDINLIGDTAGIKFINIVKLLKITKVSREKYGKRLESHKKVLKSSRKIHKAKQKTKKMYKEYIKYFKRAYLPNIGNVNQKNKLAKLYYEVECVQENMKKKDSGLKDFFAKPIMNKKKGAQRPVLLKELEFANTYAEALGFFGADEIRKLPDGSTVNKSMTAWHTFRKELKNFAEEMGKTDEKELKERALNLRLIKELTAQVGTFMPATLFTGYDLREGWKNQPAGRQIITVPQIVATNWMLSIGITLKFHNLLLELLAKGVTQIQFKVDKNMLDILVKMKNAKLLGS